MPIRVADLLGRMTLAEKAGQLAMIHAGRIRGDADLQDLFARDDVGASPAEIDDVFAPPFAAAIKAGVASVMNQHGWLNGTPIVASKTALNDLLRTKLGFDGVELTDWGDVENLFCGCQGAPAVMAMPRSSPDYERAVAAALNAGAEVSMVPDRADEFTAAVQAAVRDGLVPAATLDAAVAHVLTLKFRLGLFDDAYVAEPEADRVRLPEDAALARRAADESITVLKNARSLLPLGHRGPVLVFGPDSLRRQDGGWTVQWQGVPAGVASPPGVTVLQGVRTALGAKNVRTVASWRDTATVRAAARRARVVLVVVGEDPYAEWQGDSRTAALAGDEARLVQAVEATRTPTVLVVVAGRPLMIAGLVRHADAFVMAYLPGSEGGTAVADVLFGRVAAHGKLPFTWPAAIRDVPMALNRRLDGQPAAPLFRFGAGLTTRLR